MLSLKHCLWFLLYVILYRIGNERVKCELIGQTEHIYVNIMHITFFILKDNSIVVVKFFKIFQWSNIELEVVKYNTYSAMSNTNSIIESNIVGSFYVSTTDISDLFFIKLNYIKNKWFFVTIPNDRAIVISLLHINE